MECVNGWGEVSMSNGTRGKETPVLGNPRVIDRLCMLLHVIYYVLSWFHCRQDLRSAGQITLMLNYSSDICSVCKIITRIIPRSDLK